MNLSYGLGSQHEPICGGCQESALNGRLVRGIRPWEPAGRLVRNGSRSAARAVVLMGWNVQLQPTGSLGLRVS